jgi:1-acyl-sn-glycerol-3-phosphate acyltransferase
LAVAARVPVVPVGIRGTFEAMPHGRTVPRRAKVEVRFGMPLWIDRYTDRPVDRFVLRSITDEIMYEIMMLSEQEYVDEYASSSAKQTQFGVSEGPPVPSRQSLETRPAPPSGGPQP